MRLLDCPPPAVFRQKLPARVWILRQQRHQFPGAKKSGRKQNRVLPLFVHGVLVVWFAVQVEEGPPCYFLSPLDTTSTAKPRARHFHDWTSI
jgi:hypothetical protein